MLYLTQAINDLTALLRNAKIEPGRAELRALEDRPAFRASQTDHAHAPAPPDLQVVAHEPCNVWPWWAPRRRGPLEDGQGAYDHCSDFQGAEHAWLAPWPCKGTPRAGRTWPTSTGERPGRSPRSGRGAEDWRREGRRPGSWPRTQYGSAVRMYAEGSGTATDQSAALAWLQKSAAGGDVRAETDLGLRYIYGSGVIADQAQAAMWLKQAADRGSSPPPALIWLCCKEPAVTPVETGIAALMASSAAQPARLWPINRLLRRAWSAPPPRLSSRARGRPPGGPGRGGRSARRLRGAVGPRRALLPRLGRRQG